MTDHARHVPGSTGSCGTPLSRSATFPRHFQNLWKSTCKTQTKLRQNRKCDFFNAYGSTTYNFNAVKCLNFQATLSPPTVDKQSLGSESHDARLGRPVDCYPFSLGEKVRIGTNQYTLYVSLSCQQTYHNCTKRDKTGRFFIITKTDHALPTTYDNILSSRPVLDLGTSLEPGAWDLEFHLRLNLCHNIPL